MRVDNNIAPRLNTTTLGTPSQASSSAPTVGSQVTQNLFGRPPPPLLDPSKFPGLAATLKSMGLFRKKLASLAGDADEDYTIVLADSATAAIDADGQIYMGAQFMLENADKPEVLLGALAHEIGHQPRRWRGKGGQVQHQLSMAQLDELCQIEETRADLFAGEALAELGLQCEPLIAYLKEHETGPHRRYLPAEDRGVIIRQAFAARKRALKSRKQIFPGYERHKAARGHIGHI